MKTFVTILMTVLVLDPNKYRGRIVYDSAAKSLVAEIRPIRGLLLIVR